MTSDDRYGVDVNLLTDIDSCLSYVSGPTVVANAVARRLQTHLFYDAAYGYPLATLLNATPTDAMLRNAELAIRNQALSVSGVSDASAVLSVSGADVSVNVQLTLSTGDTTGIVGTLAGGLRVGDT